MLYIFDMGGVVTTTAHVEKGIASVLHITEDAFVQFCRGTKSGEEDLWAAYSDGRVSTAEFWRQFSARSGIAVATDWCQWFFHPVLDAGTAAIRLPSAFQRMERPAAGLMGRGGCVAVGSGVGVEVGASVAVGSFTSCFCTIRSAMAVCVPCSTVSVCSKAGVFSGSDAF